MSTRILSHIGGAGLASALFSGVYLSVALEMGRIGEADLSFESLVVVANAGLAVFAIVGLYFWVKFWKLAMASSSSLAKGIYLGSHLFAGYWAYFRYKDEVSA